MSSIISVVPLRWQPTICTLRVRVMVRSPEISCSPIVAGAWRRGKALAWIVHGQTTYDRQQQQITEPPRQGVLPTGAQPAQTPSVTDLSFVEGSHTRLADEHSGNAHTPGKKAGITSIPANLPRKTYQVSSNVIYCFNHGRLDYSCVHYSALMRNRNSFCTRSAPPVGSVA